jgi:membrane associated rhomboid family serine protease
VRHKLIRGFIILFLGAVVGAVTGGIVGFATTSPYDEFRVLEAFGVSLFGAFVGALISLLLMLARAAVRRFANRNAKVS